MSAVVVVTRVGRLVPAKIMVMEMEMSGQRNRKVMMMVIMHLNVKAQADQGWRPCCSLLKASSLSCNSPVTYLVTERRTNDDNDHDKDLYINDN